jgi:ADP-heptose:LPS heptosyltransferase
MFAPQMMRIPIPFRRRFAPGGRGSGGLRLLDRTLAVALLASIGAVRRKREPTPPLRRIGIMKSTGIGDMILATAVARDVIAAHPDAEVVLFAGADNADLARLVSGARVVQLPSAKPWAALPLLRAERLDALVDLGQWSRVEALYAALSGARWTAGFATPGQRRHYAYDATVLHSAEVRELDNYRRLVATLGVDSRSLPSFTPSPGGASPPATDPYVVFHLWPGGFRSELREWPTASWRELARRLAEEELSIVLTGGPGDAERTTAFVQSCGELAAHLAPVAGRYRLSELIDVLARARCVVSVNTGVMHLAAAAGAPTVALNGPTSALRWGPIGPNVVCVDSDLPGCGYLNLGFEYDGQRTDCMRGISVDRVATATLERTRD